MKRYTVSKARECLSDVLDEAAAGIPVAIERRDVRYVIRVERPKARPRSRQSLIETLDPGIESGQWTWSWSEKGASFKKPPRS